MGGGGAGVVVVVGDIGDDGWLGGKALGKTSEFRFVCAAVQIENITDVKTTAMAWHLHAVKDSVRKNRFSLLKCYILLTNIVD